MNDTYDILDITLLDHLETLYPGWSVWSCEAMLSDGETITGTIHSDGLSNWDLESFVADGE